MGIAGSLQPTRKSSAERIAHPAVSWQPKRDLARHEWLVVGRHLGGITRCNQWWLGDWVRYGAEKWGEKYTRAAKTTGYDPRSLANMASISAAFDSSRRRDDLTWSHHGAVAALPEEDQEAWLERAAAEHLSVADLRTELRAAPKARDKHVENGLPKALHRKDEGAGRDAEVLCPQCGYRLLQKDLG
jgi:hypothetical protein